jgi:hypothetical protein
MTTYNVLVILAEYAHSLTIRKPDKLKDGVSVFIESYCDRARTIIMLTQTLSCELYSRICGCELDVTFSQQLTTRLALSMSFLFSPLRYNGNI